MKVYYVEYDVLSGSWMGYEPPDNQHPLVKGRAQQEAWDKMVDYIQGHGGGTLQLRNINGTLGDKQTVLPVRNMFAVS